MALLVKIDGYDISDRVQAAVDEFDPAKAFSDPQFAGNSLTDGDLFISMTRHNREWTIPILIVADSNDNLNSTVRTINSHLKQGVTLEYREDGASNSTYFDVETAVLESDYRYQRNRQGFGKFVLRVWTRPLGHTGTTRLVASAIATQGIASIPIASLGLQGDAVAQIKIGVSGASAFFDAVMWGVATDAAQVVTHTVGNGLSAYLTSFSVAGTNSITPTVMAMRGLIQVGSVAPSSIAAPLPTYLWGKSVRAFVSYSPRVSGGSPSGSADTYMFLTKQDGSAEIAHSPTISWAAMGATPGVPTAHYRLTDYGVFRVPSVNGLSLGLSITLASGATQMVPSVIAHVEAIHLLPVDGASLASSPAASATFDRRSQSCDALSPSAYGAGADLSIRGEMLAVDPIATGVLHVIARSRKSEALRSRTFTIHANEQFTFFR